MSTLNLRRLQYTLRYKPASWLAERLNVSYQQVTAWGRGLGTISDAVYKPLRNSYQSTAYTEIRNSGGNTRIAKNYSTRSPEGVDSVVEELTRMVNFGTDLYFNRYTYDNNIRADVNTYKNIYPELREHVLTSMQNSIYSLDELKERY